jgi:hypothetical protein
MDSNNKKKDILRRSLLIAFLLACFAPLSFSQSANALYLKNGRRVVGSVLALDSLGDVKILTEKGETLTYPMSDVSDINWSYTVKQTGAGAIYRYGDKFRWLRNDAELTDRDYERFFDDDLYHEYVKGNNLFNIGGACWLYSFTCVVLSVMAFDPNGSQDASFYVSLGGAGVLACLGGMFTSAGKKHLNWVERTFNEVNAAGNQNLYSSSQLNSVKLSPSLIMSAQHDLALGATLSLSF